MAVFLSPVGGVAAQFFTNTGAVLTGGKLYTYLAGTTTPAATYTSAAGATFNTNPIVLDAAGRVPGSGEIWLGESVQYKFVLKDSNDVLIGTYDNVTGINSNFVNYNALEEIQVATAGQTVFTLTNSYQPGTNTLSVFVDGVNQYDGSSYSYIETNSTTVTFTAGLHVGALVKFTTAVTLSAGVTSSDLVTYLPGGSGAVATTVQAKLRQTVSVMDFGADPTGATDSKTQIQAALTYAATLGNAVVVFPSGTYRCDSGLSIDLNKVGVDGQGSKLDFSAMTTGTAITITQSASVAERNAFNMVHPIRNLYFIGPGVSVTSVYCMVIDDAADDMIPSGKVYNCVFVNFAHDVAFVNGAFCWLFESCNFTLYSGTPTTYSIENGPSTNSGERNTFIDCMWNNRTFVYDCSNANSSTFFTNCSFDYNSRVMNISAGAVYLDGCHIEQTTDVSTYFNVSGTNTILQISDSDIIFQSGKTAFSPFYSDSTCTNGGVTLSECKYTQVGSITVPLIGGTGRSVVTNLAVYQSSSRPVISQFSNYIAYGGFESANYTGEWTLSGGAVRSNTIARTGTYSLSFPGTTGTTPTASVLIPCKPGAYLFGELYYQVPAITGTGGTFYVECDWLDKGGNILSGSTIVTTTTNVSAWGRLSLQVGTTTAPTGAVNAKLIIGLFGVTSGTPVGYVDDVIIQVV